MKRLTAVLLAGILFFSVFSAFAEEPAETGAPVLSYPDKDYGELTVGNATPMDGKFFTDMWGNATSDIDVRTLVHSYYLTIWGYDTGFFRANPVTVSALSVVEDSEGVRKYRFQIADDLLDIMGTEEQMGKTLGSDLAKQKLTLPMIRLLAALDEVSRETLIDEIRNRLSTATYSKIRELLQEHEIYDSVRATTVGHIRQGLEFLSVFPESEAKKAIEGFASYAIERQC